MLKAHPRCLLKLPQRAPCSWNITAVGINAGPGVSRANQYVLRILFAVLPNLIDLATISIHLADSIAMESRICHVNVAACRTMTFLSTADTVMGETQEKHMEMLRKPH